MNKYYNYIYTHSEDNFDAEPYYTSEFSTTDVHKTRLSIVQSQFIIITMA